MKRNYFKLIKFHLKKKNTLKKIDYIQLQFFKKIYLIPKDPKLGIKSINKIKPYGLIKSILWKFIIFFYKINVSWLIIKKNKSGNLKFSDLFFAIINDTHESKKIILFHISKKTLLPEKISKIPIDIYSKKRLDNENKTLDLLSKNKFKYSPKIIKKHNIVFHEFVENKYSKFDFDIEHSKFLIKLLKKDKINIKKIKKIIWRDIKKIKFNNSNINLFKDLLDQIPNNMSIQKTISHGDFSNWNLMRNEKKKIIAIDWEFSLISSIPFVDLLNFFLKRKFLLGNGKILSKVEWQKIYNKNSFNFYLKNVFINNKHIKHLLSLSFILLTLYWHSTKFGKNHVYGIYLLKNLQKKNFFEIKNVKKN